MHTTAGSKRKMNVRSMLLLFLVLVMSLVPTLAASASDSTFIGKAKAEQIALKAAGTKKSKVKKLKCGLEKEDGVDEYEVSFTKGKYSYEYSMNARTGVIRERERALRCIGHECGPEKITKKKAIKIAMKSAGAKSATKIKAKKVTYRGVRAWEVEFKAKDHGYEYKVGRCTGRILKKEIERLA